MKTTKVTSLFDVRIHALNRALGRAKRNSGAKTVLITIVVFGVSREVLVSDVYFVEEAGRVVFFVIDEDSGACRYQWGDTSKSNGIPPSASRTERCMIEDVVIHSSLL